MRCPDCGKPYYRRNADDKLRKLERAWKATNSREARSVYLDTIERMGLEICEECDAVVKKDQIGECDCGTALCIICGSNCNNCEELRCSECTRICAACPHKHILCDSGCNDDDEFMKQCDDCEKWYCIQCADDCYEEHLNDCD